MKFKFKDDEIMSMDILPSQIVANLQVASEDEEEELLDTDTEETVTEDTPVGPWLLAITMGGYGKRVPVTQFRLQNRAGKGVKAIKFKNDKDQLVAIHVVNPEDELMIVTSRGIIMRQAVKAISLQSRNASGVRVQRLDDDDAIAAVALVPTSGEEIEEETGEIADN